MVIVTGSPSSTLSGVTRKEVLKSAKPVDIDMSRKSVTTNPTAALSFFN